MCGAHIHREIRSGPRLQLHGELSSVRRRVRKTFRSCRYTCTSKYFQVCQRKTGASAHRHTNRDDFHVLKYAEDGSPIEVGDGGETRRDSSRYLCLNTWYEKRQVSYDTKRGGLQNTRQRTSQQKMRGGPSQPKINFNSELVAQTITRKVVSKTHIEAHGRKEPAMPNKCS